MPLPLPFAFCLCLAIFCLSPAAVAGRALWRYRYALPPCALVAQPLLLLPLLTLPCSCSLRLWLITLLPRVVVPTRVMPLAYYRVRASSVPAVGCRAMPLPACCRHVNAALPRARCAVLGAGARCHSYTWRRYPALLACCCGLYVALGCRRAARLCCRCRQRFAGYTLQLFAAVGSSCLPWLYSRSAARVDYTYPLPCRMPVNAFCVALLPCRLVPWFLPPPGFTLPTCSCTFTFS